MFVLDTDRFLSRENNSFSLSEKTFIVNESLNAITKVEEYIFSTGEEFKSCIFNYGKLYCSTNNKLYSKDYLIAAYDAIIQKIYTDALLTSIKIYADKLKNDLYNKFIINANEYSIRLI